MGDPVSLGLAIGGVVGASALESKRQQKETRKLQSRQDAANRRIQAEAEARIRREESESVRRGVSAARKAGANAMRTSYNRSTILTSPLGVVGGAGAGKTLLGG